MATSSITVPKSMPNIPVNRSHMTHRFGSVSSGMMSSVIRGLLIDVAVTYTLEIAGAQYATVVGDGNPYCRSWPLCIEGNVISGRDCV